MVYGSVRLGQTELVGGSKWGKWLRHHRNISSGVPRPERCNRIADTRCTCELVPGLRVDPLECRYLLDGKWILLLLRS